MDLIFNIIILGVSGLIFVLLIVAAMMAVDIARLKISERKNNKHINRRF